MRSIEEGGTAPTGTKPGHESLESALGLFQGFGVELEHMIVDTETLDVRPVADRLMAAVAGSPVSELELGPLAWSNELALHVLEVKTNGPAERLEGLGDLFHGEVRRANDVLEGMGCRLLPGGMHPWMDPDRETRLWPHEYTEVYRTFDRIFSCRGHGWANLQSTHLNLPFQGDREFAALHAAIRMVLPVLPALSASSPILEGKPGTHLDERLAAYRSNSIRVPTVAGVVIPEPAASRREYEEVILAAIYRDMEPLDPDGVLRHEWVNARGAIARFQRGSIEIRTVDSQECAGADLAVTALIARAVEGLCRTALDDAGRFNAFETRRLAGILEDVIREGDCAVIRDREYLDALGAPGTPEALQAGDVWGSLADRWGPAESDSARAFLGVILDQGPLARRILRATGTGPDRERLREVYRELADCLAENRPFLPGGRWG